MVDKSQTTICGRTAADWRENIPHTGVSNDEGLEMVAEIERLRASLTALARIKWGNPPETEPKFKRFEFLKAVGVTGIQTWVTMIWDGKCWRCESDV